MLPNSIIVISKNGNSKIIGKEQCDDCYELGNLGKEAGKVVDEKKKDHAPVRHGVFNKERG